ncbi:MAG: hypothetical protein ABH821_04220 [archaeon]
MKKIVVPGEMVSEERKKLGEHVFVENGKVLSDCIGIVVENPNIASVIPLHGIYLPKQGDIVIGIVESEKFSGYTVDVDCVHTSYISKESWMRNIKPGSVISAKVNDVNELGEPKLSEVRVLNDVEIIKVSPVKIPRIIGKNNSMLDVLREGTKSFMVVGKNGFVAVKGGDIMLLTKALRLIEKKSHLSDLTNGVQKFLKKGE